MIQSRGMVRVRPVLEHEAKGQTLVLYREIKERIHSDSVPVIFQYLAAFPEYLSFLWEQAREMVGSPQFQQEAAAITSFSQMAIQTCYTPSPATQSYRESLQQAEWESLQQFVSQVQQTNSLLYLLALAIRESLKGKYLGLKQISSHLSEEQRQAFFTVAAPPPPPAPSSPLQAGQPITSSPSALVRGQGQPTGLATTSYGQFFSRIEREMKEVVKEVPYLMRRVELERFSLAKLTLLSTPLDSSFVEVTRRSADHPHFADLIYLLSDVFPTETPYKLLSSCVMERALTFSPSSSTSLSHS